MRNPKFDALLVQMGVIHDKKNEDYANDNPYSNFETAAGIARGFRGTDAVFATLIGIKIARLQELIGGNKTPNNESVEDSLLDLAVYAALWASYRGVGDEEVTA